jgi:hypothetical protein
MPDQYDGGSPVELAPELEAAQKHSAELDVMIGSLRTDLKRNAQRIDGLAQSLHIARLRQQSLIGALAPFDDVDGDGNLGPGPSPEPDTQQAWAPF